MRVTTLFLFALLPFSAGAQRVWQIDPAHTNAEFSVRHMGISTVRGSFTKTTGTVEYDPANLSKTKIDATIDANSVDTRNDMRDNDLRGPHFFEVAKYPTLTFKSTSAEAIGAGKVKVTGDLTIHGVTKQVVLNVEGPSAPIQVRGSSHIGAAASTTVKRSDFGMTAMQGAVGDDISINIDVELIQAAPAPHS